MTVEIQNMFGDDFSNDSLKRILRILENVAQCRKISDVWTLYESLCSKIPLLDDGDIEKIPEEEKEYFETHYG